MTIRYDDALLDPASAFPSPEALLAHKHLSRTQKIELLRRWEYDANEMAVADEEGMGDPQIDSDLLRRIHHALAEAGAVVDVNHRPPTKQGGI